MRNRQWSIRKNASAINTTVVMRSAFPNIVTSPPLRLRRTRQGRSGGLLEGLVFAEVSDRQPQGIHWDHVVLDPVLFHEHDVGDVLLALGDFARRGRVVDLLEVRRGAVR